MRQPIAEMVRKVIQESQEKLASERPRGIQKTAGRKAETQAQGNEKVAGDYTEAALSKLADACDFLADHLHEVVDKRTPQEKLAEYHAIHQAVVKRAFEVGNQAPPEPSLSGYKGEGDKGPHQTEEANAESQPPEAPPQDSGAPAVGGPDTAMKAVPATTPGESMDAGESGESTPAHQPPADTVPEEKPTPTSAPNAMKTNKDMMMPPQPEDVLKQSWAKDLLKKAKASGVPTKMASALISKLAEDAIFPAQIVAGTEPALQSAPGTPSQLSQGSEAGDLTPRETAPNVGEGSGRQYIASNEAAINMTKGEAKQQNKPALAEVLTEPALSDQHEKVLTESLDNTPAAGVKISAVRELLKKFAAQSPNHGKLVAELIKRAQEFEAAPEIEPPSDEAMAAAAAGVTPEELEVAHGLLSLQGAEAAGAEEEALPMEGEAPETEEAVPTEAPPMEGGKASQIGMAPPMGGSNMPM